MMRLGILVGVWIVMAMAISHGSSLEQAQKAFATGNAAYEKADYAMAETHYRRAIDQGIADSKLYYNYANALFRENKLGLAILYWEKAAKLRPNDADIEHNLRFARSRIVDKIPEPQANFFTQALWALHAGYSINAGLWVGLALFSLFFAALLAALSAATWLRLAGIGSLAIAVLGLIVLTPSLIYKIRQQESVQSAIALKPVLEIYSGPGDSYQLLARVHEGTKFTLEEVKGEWVSVKLSNGTGGWTRFAELGKI